MIGQVRGDFPQTSAISTASARGSATSTSFPTDRGPGGAKPSRLGGSAESALDTILLVETPEHIALRYQVAGPGRRAAAYGIDLLVRALVLLVVGLGLMLTSMASRFGMGGFEIGLLLILFFVLEWGYFVSFELMWAGATPGKRAMHLRAIHQDGRNLSPRESILRNLLRAADLLPTGYALGVVTMCFDSRFRRLGDLAAGTVVVSEPRTRLATTRTSSAHVEIAGLVQRPRLSAEERAALALFARRRPHLSQARVEELAALLAPSMRRRFGVPEAPDVALLEALHHRSSLS